MKAGRGGGAVVTSDVEHEGIPFGPEDFDGIVKAASQYHQTQGDLQHAQNAYSLAIMLQPGNASLYSERSSVRWRLGQAQAARDDQRVARLLQGLDADALERRDAAIQTAVPQMPVAEISDPQGDAFARVNWARPATTVQGEHIYGLRFVTPEERVRLLWAFVLPEPASWYILPASGIMRGFDSFTRTDGEVNLGGDRQRREFIAQSLDPSNLEPGTEYALWFSFPDDAPRHLWYLIFLIPE